jgi:fermentation-respiration switch protein FrsA (DUF1100 family)
LLVGTTYCYVGILVVLLFFENWFLFKPYRADEHWADPPAGLTVEDVELRGANNTRLHAWWSKPEGWHPVHGALLYCHGNAGNLSHRGESLRRWHTVHGLAVLIFDYPGYGRSEGKPTEAGCYAAGDAAYTWLTTVAKVPADRVILYGGSLGGAIAIDLAARHPHRAVVLVSAFTSFPDMAQKTFPWLPARWLVRNRLDNLTKIATLKTPIFIAHGTADGLIPFSHGERLYQAAHEPKRFFPMPGTGHEQVPVEELHEAIRRFLAETDAETAIVRAN